MDRTAATGAVFYAPYPHRRKAHASAAPAASFVAPLGDDDYLVVMSPQLTQLVASGKWRSPKGTAAFCDAFGLFNALGKTVESGAKKAIGKLARVCSVLKYKELIGYTQLRWAEYLASSGDSCGVYVIDGPEHNLLRHEAKLRVAKGSPGHNPTFWIATGLDLQQRPIIQQFDTSDGLPPVRVRCQPGASPPVPA